MTTIAYKDGILACDSKVSGSGAKFCTWTKIFDLGNAVAAFSGPILSIEIIKEFIVKSPKKWQSALAKKPDGSELAVGIVLVKKKIWIIESSIAWQVEEQPLALGSGSAFALGAMYAGFSAPKAIEIACQLDCYSGLPVQQRVVK